MKAFLILVVTVVAVAGIAFSVCAEQVVIGGRILPVYDQNGAPVPASIARATGLAPVSLEHGKPQGITISAAVLPSLKVNLSSTQIAWEIKKTGTFQTRAIDIAIGIDDDKEILATDSDDASLLPRPVATMLVTGANNLEQPVPVRITTSSVMPPFQPTALPTYYALMPTAARGVPGNSAYLPAEKFNGGHAIRSLRTSLWNKLSVSDKFIDANAYPAGKYQDEFTVTFMQVL